MDAKRWFLAAVLVLAVVFSPGSAARSPGEFALLHPSDQAVVHASAYGDLPVLAWEEKAGIARYEVWMDGTKVDEIPAGVHGHLPGEKRGNYEPFRPHGLLPASQVCYYTPSVSRLTVGPHQWFVVAVDGDGDRRRSMDAFRFNVRELSSGKVFVNHPGYLAGTKARVVVDGEVGASSFDLLDPAGKVVLSGDLTNGEAAFGDYLLGEFMVPEMSVTCRIRAGTEMSMGFPIGMGARLGYETALRKYRHACRRKRCGDTSMNWSGQACHLDDARMLDGERHAIVGGWHASSDVRKIMRILQPALTGLVELKRVADPAWDDGEYSLLDEIQWGNRYIHRMQNKDGAVVQHYYLWCGATDWSEAINRYTNNVPGDADDRLLPEETLVIDMVSQSRFIWNQAAIHRQYRNVDPAYARKCLEAAARCHAHFLRTWPVVTDYETSFNARPYKETVTDLMPLAYGVRANLAMHLATNDTACRDRAVALADQLMALQETGFVGNQEDVRGFFYANPDREVIFDSCMAHGGLDGAPGAVMVLADLCDALPNHPNSPRWKECLRSYLEDFLVPLSRRNAFGIVPGYLSKAPLPGGRPLGALHYRYLDDNRGVNKFLVRKAILLARGARILNKPGLRDVAWRQVGWVLGNNPMKASTVYGVGQGQPTLYKSYLAPRSDGMVVQGLGGDANDRPHIRQGHWRHCEMELHHSAWLARAVMELLAAEQ